MSDIKISYLGLVRNTVGKSEEEVAFEGTTVRELLDLLCTRHGDSFRYSLLGSDGRLRASAKVLLGTRDVDEMQGLDTPLEGVPQVSILVVVYPVEGG